MPSDLPTPGRRGRVRLPRVSRGRLVILNGTSSAGKTTLGRAMQDGDGTPWVLTGIDHYWSRLPRRYLEDEIGNPDGFRSLYEGEGEARRTVGFVVGPTFRRLMYGLHRTVAALVEAGNDVLVDYLPFDEAMARDAVSVWAELDGVLVAVRPPLEVSERWERERGDRDLGQARVMFDQAHSFGRFDLVIDTSVTPPHVAADLVLAHLRLAERATALTVLHRRMFGGAGASFGTAPSAPEDPPRRPAPGAIRCVQEEPMAPIERSDAYAGLMHLAVAHGDTVYLAGIVPDDLGADMEGQARDVLRQLDEAAAAHGLDRSRVLTATIFVTDMSEKPAMNRVWQEFFDPAHLPARATIGVADLGPGVRLEMVATLGR